MICDRNVEVRSISKLFEAIQMSNSQVIEGGGAIRMTGWSQVEAFVITSNRSAEVLGISDLFEAS